MGQMVETLRKAGEEMGGAVLRPVGVLPQAVPIQAPPPVHPAAYRRMIVTQDPTLQRLLEEAAVVAPTDATVLIEGESGTGKELVARYIHEKSARAGRPFVAINCAAVPEGLLESELFGYEKGAFTGAQGRRLGRFEMASSGTLLLDEIGEMPLSLQVKLLRVLQEREIDPLGGREPVPLDIRVVATTNRCLSDDVAAGRFREDLYYRICTFPLAIPPLRERVCDIPILLDHFIKRGSIRYKKAVSIGPEVLAALEGRQWRGNVREFEGVIERAILLAHNGRIAPEDLSPRVSLQGKRSPYRVGSTLREVERSFILETLQQVGNNRTYAARTLGISIRTLRNKLRGYRASI